ncbi:MAG: response regulator [Fibrobacterota bacterium]
MKRNTAEVCDRILVAEDDRFTQDILRMLLGKWGYKADFFSDGNDAWEEFRKNGHSMAMLDWMMPGMDGISLIQKMRAQRKGPNLYIIVLTTKGEQDDIVKALEAGADEFVTKPFDKTVLRSHIEVGRRILRSEQVIIEKNAELEHKNRHMEQLVAERTKQLLHAEKLSTLGMLSAGVVHEINNPASYISGNAQLLQKYFDILHSPLEEYFSEKDKFTEKTLRVYRNMPKAVEGINNGIKKINRIVKGLKYFSKKDTGDKKLHSVGDLINQALEVCHNRLKYHVKIETDIDPEARVYADAGQIDQVLVNLFINSADATETVGNGLLKISAYKSGDYTEITTEDNGGGIPEEMLENIWEPFFTTKAEGKGTGLGLSIIYGIIESHSGKIRVENIENGAKFTISLPSEERRAGKVY